MKDWTEVKRVLLQSDTVRRTYEESELEYQIARAIIRARATHNLTQAQLAEKIRTKQSVISRLERGMTTPSLGLLKRLATVLNANLLLEFRHTVNSQDPS